MSYDFIGGIELPIEETVCEIWFTDRCGMERSDCYHDGKEFGFHRFKSYDDMFTEWFFITGLSDCPTPDDDWGVQMDFEGECEDGDGYEYHNSYFWVEFNPVPHPLVEGYTSLPR